MLRTGRLHTPFVAPPTPDGVGVSLWPAAGGGVLSNLFYQWYGPAGAYNSAHRNQDMWPGYLKTMFGTGADRVVALGWRTEPLGEIPNGRTRLLIASPKALLSSGTVHRNPNTLWMLISQDGEALVLNVQHRRLRMVPARLFAEGTSGAHLWATAFAWAKDHTRHEERSGTLATRVWPKGWWSMLLAPKAIAALSVLLPVARDLAAQGVPGATDRWEPEHLGHWMGGDSTRPVNVDLVQPCKEALATIATLLPERFADAVLDLRAGTLDPDGTGGPPTLRVRDGGELCFSHRDLDRLLWAMLDARTRRGLVRGGGARCTPHTIPQSPLSLVVPHDVGPSLVALSLPARAPSAHAQMARVAHAHDYALRILGRLPDPEGFVQKPET